MIYQLLLIIIQTLLVVMAPLPNEAPPDSTSSPSPSPSTTPPASQSLNGGSSCPIPDALCFYGSSNDLGEVELTIHASAKGYAAIGIGAEMASAFIFVAWQSSQGPLVSYRKSSGYKVPDPTNEAVSLVSSVIPAPPWASLSVTFKVPSTAGITAQSHFIYAVSDSPVSEPDNQNSEFRKHDKFGKLDAVDFTAKSSRANVPTSPQQHTEQATAQPPTQTTTNPPPDTVPQSQDATPVPLLPNDIPRIDPTKPDTVPVSQESSTNTKRDEFSLPATASLDSPANKVCPEENHFCLYGSPTPEGNGNFQFTIHSASNGYIGFGTGTDMSDSHMYVVWKNSTGGFTVSPRKSTQAKRPELTEERVDVLPLAIPAPEWAKLAVTFRTTANPPITSSTKYMYASSEAPPAGNVDDVGAQFSKHTKVGQIGQFDITKKV